MKVRDSSFEAEASIERGCPRGSMWKFIFNNLLGALENERFPATPHVEDLAIVVCPTVELAWTSMQNGVPTKLNNSARGKILIMAASKTQTMLLKGKTDRGHP